MNTFRIVTAGSCCGPKKLQAGQGPAGRGSRRWVGLMPDPGAVPGGRVSPSASGHRPRRFRNCDSARSRRGDCKRVSRRGGWARAASITRVPSALPPALYDRAAQVGTSFPWSHRLGPAAVLVSPFHRCYSNRAGESHRLRRGWSADENVVAAATDDHSCEDQGDEEERRHRSRDWRRCSTSCSVTVTTGAVFRSTEHPAYHQEKSKESKKNAIVRMEWILFNVNRSAEIELQMKKKNI